MNVYLYTKAENLSPGQLKYLSRYVVFLAPPHLFVYHRGWSTHINCAAEICVEILEIRGGGGVKFWGLILADFLPALLWGWYR